MKSRACVLHAKEDVRIETTEIGPVGPEQVLIRVQAGGICGSDIHYYWEGGIGTIRVSEPIVLGHEFAGRVEAVGANVGKLQVGELVAVNPSKPCGTCKFCREGYYAQCMNMEFLGSASRVPHTHGGFRDYIVVEGYQCVPVGSGVSAGEAACTEPLAVGVHAVRQAGDLFGKKVLVTGAGPIGALLIGALHQAGAGEIVAMDLAEAPLRAALAMGADVAVNATAEPDRLVKNYSAEKGYFDVAFECAGARVVLKQLFPVVRPHGVIVQVGVSGGADLPANELVAKEIQLRGSHRFYEEYAMAAELIRNHKVDVRPVISATLPMEQVGQALVLARDRSSQMKVQLSFDSQA